MMERQCVWFDSPHRVSVRREPMPNLLPDQVLVKTIVSAISAGTELLFYRGLVPSDMPLDATLEALSGDVRYPLSYGYACVGRIVELGVQVPGEWNGHLVFSFHPHASHFVARLDQVIPVAEEISPEQAAFLPNMETAVNLMMDGAPIIGERVVVLGQGIVGLLTAGLLAKMPLDRLLTFDYFSLRREKSRGLGIADVFDPQDAHTLEEARGRLGEDGADVTFELSGNPDALNQALALTGFDGRIIIGSWYGQKKNSIDLGGKFHRSRIRLISSQVSTLAPSLTGRWSKARRLDVAWSMIRQIRLTDLITHRIPIGDAARAYELLDQHSDQALQVLLTYE